MKSALLIIFMFSSLLLFSQTTEQKFFNSVKGKSIMGKSVEGIDTTFAFSNDGKSVMLKKNKGYNHTFVKMVGDVAVYQGKRAGKMHYEAFKVMNDKNVILLLLSK